MTARKNSDPLVEALDQAEPIGSTGQMQKVDAYFENRPEVKEAIRRARVERKLSFKQIALILSKDPNVQIGEGSVKNWLQRQGIS